MALYTVEELKTKIKTLMEDLDDGVSSSDLDTSQSKHGFKISVRAKREQLERYLAMLKKQDPACYYSFMPPSVISFGGNRC
jgi:hypothetical protein